jgi:hypothetical protein
MSFIDKGEWCRVEITNENDFALAVLKRADVFKIIKHLEKWLVESEKPISQRIFAMQDFHHLSQFGIPVLDYLGELYDILPEKVINKIKNGEVTYKDIENIISD